MDKISTAAPMFSRSTCSSDTLVVDDITGSSVIQEIDMAAAQSGSNTISAHRMARNNSDIHICDVAGFNDVVAIHI